MCVDLPWTFVEKRLAESVRCRPHPALRPWVIGYSGSRLRGFDAGVHLALPSDSVVVVISLDSAIEMAAPDGSELRSYRSPVAALHRSPRAIGHQGRAFDISIEMKPAGALALLGSRAAFSLTGLWNSPTFGGRVR